MRDYIVRYGRGDRWKDKEDNKRRYDEDGTHNERDEKGYTYYATYATARGLALAHQTFQRVMKAPGNGHT